MNQLSLIAGRLKRAPRRLLALPATYEEQIYSALVCRGDICFDVGANNGDVALYLGRLAGVSGLVVAFEPVFPTFCLLSARIQRWGLLGAPILPIFCGLSDCESRSVVNIPNGEFGLASIASTSAWQAAHAGARMESYRIQLTTLDIFMSLTSLFPTFVKIDVEGAELLTLRGANDLLSNQRSPVMLIEVFAPWERSFGYRPGELLEILSSGGYEFLFACPNGLVAYKPTMSRPFPPQFEGGYNVVAYKTAQHADRLKRIAHLFEGASPRLRAMRPPPQPNRVIV